VGGYLDPPERQRPAPPFPPLVTIRVVSETCTRWPIAERGAVGAESRENAEKSGKIVGTEPVGQGSASAGARFLAQDFDCGQNDGRGLV
jgi:hypothetical protein